MNFLFVYFIVNYIKFLYVDWNGSMVERKIFSFNIENVKFFLYIEINFYGLFMVLNCEFILDCYVDRIVGIFLYNNEGFLNFVLG